MLLGLTRQAQNRIVFPRFFSKHSVFLNDSNQQSEISNQNKHKSKSNETRVAGDLLRFICLLFFLNLLFRHQINLFEWISLLNSPN